MIPNLSIQEMPKPIGRYGKMRCRYLEEKKPMLYNDLILTEKLFPHLLEADEIAQRRFDILLEQMKIQRKD